MSNTVPGEQRALQEEGQDVKKWSGWSCCRTVLPHTNTGGRLAGRSGFECVQGCVFVVAGWEVVNDELGLRHVEDQGVTGQ